MTANVDDCVLIAGAGPVGLSLALCLAESGIAVRVFEAEPDIVEDLRASTFHPPTLDMLDSFGISDELIAQGLICAHWQVRLHPTGDRAVFDLSVIADRTAHPYRLQCEQWKLSRALLARLIRHPNAEINFNARVQSAAQDANGAVLTVERGTKTETVRGRYLVGCDGARSEVRHAMGLSFEGETYPETTILATTRFPFDEHLPGLSNVSYCWKDGGKDGGGNFSLLRLPGVWRTSIYPTEGVAIEDALAPTAIAASLGEIVPEARDTEVIEVRPYRVHQRIAAQYRIGRLLLAGDAAHINSPAGGMGMNGGVHDAFNLAEKLAGVWAGESDQLLDLYERQRRPIAQQQIIAQADANRARMRERDPQKRRDILDGLKAIIADKEKLHTHLLRTSMIAGLDAAARVN